MQEYPMTFAEFIKSFSTEDQCREYLYRLRFPNGFVCPKCENTKSWKKGDTLYECSECGHQTSVIAGTIFQDTRKPLRDWFIAVWWLTTQKYGASAEGIKQILGLKSDQTAWTWLHKIRTAMVSPNRIKLHGNIEVDEAFIGGDTIGGKRGRGAEGKALIIIAVEVIEFEDKGQIKDKQGRIRMNIIPDASSETLHKFIEENIEKGSTIITDDWNGYSGLEKKNYIREIHNQTKAKTDEDMLPHVHLIVSLLKRWLLGTHQGAVSKKHLQAYLNEYVFRFNRRTSAKRGLLFYRFLENAMAVPPTSYKELVGKPKP